MYGHKLTKAFTAMMAALLLILFGGMITSAGAFSMDVRNFSYSDDSDRSVVYDFTNGTVGTEPPNAIQLEGGVATITKPSGESNSSYFWGAAPGLPAVTVTKQVGSATVSTTTEGVAVFYAVPTDGIHSISYPTPTPPTSWLYTVELGNFNVDTSVDKAYEFDIGLGNDEAVVGLYNNATVSVVWVKGYYNGQMYTGNTLIIQAHVRYGDNTYWESTPIVRQDLVDPDSVDPATTTLKLELSVSSGNQFSARVTTNNESPQSLGSYTLTLTQGTFQRFPDLYPYIYMSEESASTDPQAFVHSQHWSDGYYAGFWVPDPLHKAYAVHVTGSNCDSYPLFWDEKAKTWYNHPIFIGASPVTDSWPSYTFTFTPQTGGAAIPSIAKSITGYVTEFATNLQPSGNISTIPTFTWTAAQGNIITSYGIEVNDASTGARVWSWYGIPPTQTSFQYNGPPLVTGKAYRYHILSQIETDGVDNSSFAVGNFTWTGTGGTITFNGGVKTFPNWPATDGATVVTGADVGAYAPGGETPLVTTTPDSISGVFSLTGIPASSDFFLRVGAPSEYKTVLSKIMNWNTDINALLPFALLTDSQYAALNTAGNGMIIGRIALNSNPSTFLSGATVTAVEWNNGVAGATYQVTYTGGTSTGSDGIFMVLNVPSGKLVKLTATLSGYTFLFNGSIVPTWADHVSEDSFFAVPASVSFSGVLMNADGTAPIAGATVEMAGNSSIHTTTDSNGAFLLEGLPAGQPFSVKMSKTDYLPTYTQTFNVSSPISAARNYNLITANDLATLGTATDTAVIRGRVMNSANLSAGYINGAVVSYTSVLGKNYQVRYDDGSGIPAAGTATSANGKFYILDVAPGDIVTVTATHSNYAIQPTVFGNSTDSTHANSVYQGLVKGTADSGYVGIGGHIMNTASPAVGIKNVTVEQVGTSNPVNATVSNADGSFYLTVPKATAVQLKFSKPQDISLADTYSADMTFYGDNPAISDFNLFFKTTLSGWGIASGKGIIRARVKDADENYIAGATMTAQSTSKTYPVCYDDTCTGTLTSTDASGRYVVKNVDNGDTVTVTAQKDGWMFNTRTFHTHGDSMHQGSVWGRNNLLVNGSFSGNLDGWVVNPALQTGTPPWNPLLEDGSGVSLHPDIYSFIGTILYQNLNLTGVAGKTLSLSVTLSSSYAFTTGNTVALWLTYIDGSGNPVRVKVLNPANSSITQGTLVTGSFAVPDGAQKIVKLELVKEYYGDFNADDVVLWADGITSDATPALDDLSPTSGAYGSTLTITGTNFGMTAGQVKIGGVPATVTNWTNASITVSVVSPLPSGNVVVIAGNVESNPSPFFTVTSPHFVTKILNPDIKVIKGQKAEFVFATSFYNGFTTEGITLELQGGNAATLSGLATFVPVPIRTPGGVVLKIDTSGLAAGSYTADVVAKNGAVSFPVGKLNLKVVTVKSIAFYEMVYDPVTTRVDLGASLTVTSQGLFNIYTELTGSDDEVITDSLDAVGANPGPGVVLTVSPGASPILGIYNRLWGYDLYAQANGTTTLRATTPDGTSKDLPITVNFPTDSSYISGIGLTVPDGAEPLAAPNTVYNNRTSPITWYATATTPLDWIGYDSSGLMNFQIDFLDKVERSDDGRSVTSTFGLQQIPADIGTVILYAQTQDRQAKAAVPLTTINDPATGLLSFYIRNLDPNAFAEMFQIYFYGASDGQLKFKRDVFAMHTGDRPALVGNIPPGTYKILFVPGYPGVRPQWWPNATDISGAAPLTFTAEGTVGDVYFFAMPQEGTVSLNTASHNLTSSQAATGSFTFTAAPNYGWSATASDSWITITSGMTGTGNGTVNYSVTANPFSYARTGTITVGGQSYTITQAGTGIVPPWVGTWGVQQLIHFDDGYNETGGGVVVPWYSEVDRTTLNEDGTGTMVMKKNDHNGELINQTVSFNYTMVKNADGSLTFSGNVGEGYAQVPFSTRMVIGDDGKVGIVDGTLEEHQQKLMVLFRIDTTKTYSAADISGGYYHLGFERNNTDVVDPPNGNGAFMAISGIHSFNGAGSYTYDALANSVKKDGTNVIWHDDQSKITRYYSVAGDGTFTAGSSGTFQGTLTGDSLVGGGAGAFAQGVNNQVAYFFMKKGDRTYSTADLAGKWVLAAFGQDSKTIDGTIQGFYSSLGTMFCDAAGNCAVKVKDRNSDNTTKISTENMALTVAADGSFGTIFGGQSPAYAGAIGNNGNTILLNPSFHYTSLEDPWNREIVIGIRASDVGDLTGGGTISTHPEAATIQARFEAALARLIAGDFSETTGFAGYIATDFLDKGQNKAMFLAELQQETFNQMTWTIQSILGTGDMAEVHLTWGDGELETLYFKKEGDVWMLYGDQKLFDVWANSGYQANAGNPTPYWVSLSVRDTGLAAITGVNVTGPGLPTEGIQLYHNTEEGEWHSWSRGPEQQNLGPYWASMPGVPLDYTFTISYTGGTGTSPAVETFRIESFVTAAPSEGTLSPAAGTTATFPLTFSWGSAGSGYRYRIELNDANYNRIWESDWVTGTSVIYNGTALSAGNYTYNIITMDGYENMSMIQVPFNMPEPSPTIGVTGKVYNWAGTTPLNGATVQLWAGGTLQKTMATGTDGVFSFSDILAGQTFYLRMSATNLHDVYSADLNFASTAGNVDLGTYNLPTDGELAPFGLQSGKGMIAGRIRDQQLGTGGNVAGVVVTATSTGHPSGYTVTYRDPLGNLGGTATYGNGRYYVLNVDNADVVTATAMKVNRPQAQRSFHTFGDAVNEGSIYTQAPAYDALFGGTVYDSQGQPIGGARIEIDGTPGRYVFSGTDGTFQLSGLPRDVYMNLKISKDGSVTYTGAFNLGGNVTGVPLTLFTAVDLSNMGVTTGNGLIAGKAVRSVGNGFVPIAGATVTVASNKGQTYVVNYSDGGTTTGSNGSFWIPNVVAGDVVTVSVKQSGAIFPETTYLVGYANAATIKLFTATLRKGDLNGDVRVDLADAVLSLQAMAGMNPAGIRTDYVSSGMDVNDDGKIGVQELIYILQYIAGLRAGTAVSSVP